LVVAHLGEGILSSVCNVLLEQVATYWSCGLPSNAKAKPHSTWSWHQVNRPWLRATLHPVRMCLNLAGDEHKGQEGFSPTQRFRFCGDGRTSYVDLI